MIQVPQSGKDDLTYFCEISAAKLQQDFMPRLATALSAITEDQYHVRIGPSVNSIAVLLAHMEGNLRQWVISGLGGAPDVRDRKKEFAPQEEGSGARLREALAIAVDEASGIIRTASPESLRATMTIQTYTVTGVEAVYHAVEHFSYHLGQVIHEAKRLSGKDLALYPF